MQAIVDNGSCNNHFWIRGISNAGTYLQRYAGSSQVSIENRCTERLPASNLNDRLLHFRSVEDTEATSMVVSGITSSAFSFGYLEIQHFLADSVATTNDYF